MIFLSQKSNKFICFLYTNSMVKKSKTAFILKGSLFGSAKVTKNDDLVKYKYSSYSTGFDSPLEF